MTNGKKDLLIVGGLGSLLLLLMFNRFTRELSTGELSLEDEKQHIDNSLEGVRGQGFKNPHEAAMYVWGKHFLGVDVPNKQQIIDYFNSKQEADGAWTGARTRMFTTGRVLGAYYLLGAKPAKSLDEFFRGYDTWEEALAYDFELHGKWDGRDIYHIVFAWMVWSIMRDTPQYPPWLDDFFAKVEENLDWTTNPTGYQGGHRRTHILYTYVYARRPWPNLDGIIDTTLAMQRSDGSFPGLSDIGDVSASWNYDTSIELGLLQQVLKLYPDYRTTEIQAAINRTIPYLYSQYRTQVYQGVTHGYFSPEYHSLERSVTIALIGTSVNGLVGQADMTFEDIVNKMFKILQVCPNNPFLAELYARAKTAGAPRLMTAIENLCTRIS